MPCRKAPVIRIGDAGANVNGIIIVVIKKLLFNCILTTLLEIKWCPNVDLLPLLGVSCFALVAPSGFYLMSMNLCYCVWFRVVRSDVFLRFLFQ